jgi:predicted O-methyltransferase YrrM
VSQLEVDVDNLLQSLTFGDDPFGSFIGRSSAAGLPEIQVSTVFGRYLELLVRITGACLVLEVGTLGGYSAAWMARALEDGGRIISCEIDAHHAETARENLASVGLADRVDVRVAPALETLAALREDPTVAGHVDLAFIDADKENNANYLDLAVELAHQGTVLIVDNVVRDGGILDESSSDPRVVGTRAVLTRLGQHPRLRATAIQTVGAKHHDGFAIAVVD